MIKASAEKMKLVLIEFKKERESLPEYSMFGGNNWKPLDIAIRMLETALDGTYSQDKYEFYLDEYDLVYSVSQWLEYGDDNTDLINDYEV